MIYNTVLESTTTDEVNYLAGVKLTKFEESMSIAECFATIIAESTLEWNTIMQESTIDTLIETSRIVLGEADAPKKSFKEFAIEMLDKVIGWFKSIFSKIGGAFSKLIDSAKGYVLSAKKYYGGKSINGVTDNIKLMELSLNLMTEKDKTVNCIFPDEIKAIDMNNALALARGFKDKISKYITDDMDDTTRMKRIAEMKKDSGERMKAYYGALIDGVEDKKAFEIEIIKKYGATAKDVNINATILKNAFEYITSDKNFKKDTKDGYDRVKKHFNDLIKEVNDLKKKVTGIKEAKNDAKEAIKMVADEFRQVGNICNVVSGYHLKAIGAKQKGARAIVDRCFKFTMANEKTKKSDAKSKGDKEQAANASFMFDFESSFNPELI